MPPRRQVEPAHASTVVSAPVTAAGASIDPATPVLVGVGVSSASCEPLELMVAAAEAAAADAGSTALLGKIDLVAVPKGNWSYTDPGALLAARFGSASGPHRPRRAGRAAADARLPGPLAHHQRRGGGRARGRGGGQAVGDGRSASRTGGARDRPGRRHARRAPPAARRDRGPGGDRRRGVRPRRAVRHHRQRAARRRAPLDRGPLRTGRRALEPVQRGRDHQPASRLSRTARRVQVALQRRRQPPSRLPVQQVAQHTMDRRSGGRPAALLRRDRDVAGRRPRALDLPPRRPRVVVRAPPQRPHRPRRLARHAGAR